ncbi:MAG: hypothetical protein AB8C13_08275 [Phycisphaerales bacterium]
MNTKKSTTLAILIAATLPLSLTGAAFAGPEHNHDHDAMASDHAAEPTMDAKAKMVWDKAIEATMSENAKDEWVKSMRMSGVMSIPSQGIDAKLNILMATGQGMYFEMDIPGLGSFEQGVNGDIVWSNNMMEGPKVLDGKQATQMLQQMDFYADLHWDQYFQTISYMGEETITMPDGTDVKTHKLELISLEDGSVSNRFYDAESGLNVMASSMIEIAGGAQVPSTSYNMDFRDVEGMMFPFKTVSSSGPMEQIMTFDSVEVNVDLQDGELELPEDIKELVED